MRFLMKTTIFHSFRFRLFLVMILVTILAVNLTAFLSSRAATGEFRNYLELRFGKREDRFIKILTTFYGQAQTWEGVQELVQNLGEAIDERVILTNMDGKVVGDSAQNTKIGEPLSLTGAPLPPIIIQLDRAPVGKLYIDPFHTRQSEDESAVARINRGVVTGTVLVLLAALGLAYWLSQRILRPVEELTNAAQLLKDGNLSARVKNNSKDEIGKLSQSFNEMASSLARLEQVRRNMVTDVAHELRTPLSNMRGYLEAARDGLVPPDENLIENLYEETMLLNRMVEDLQELALAESGHLRLDFQPEEMARIVLAAVDAVRPRALAGNLELEVDTPSDLPPVIADSQRVGQVLRNLLNNAINYTPPGGKIKVIVRALPREVLVAVEDNGEGIAMEHQPYIFERFFRVDASRERPIGGAGLGLAIVRQLVNLHGGRVWVESAPGMGATFWFSLPIVPADEHK